MIALFYPTGTEETDGMEKRGGSKQGIYTWDSGLQYVLTGAITLNIIEYAILCRNCECVKFFDEMPVNQVGER